MHTNVIGLCLIPQIIAADGLKFHVL